MYNEQTGLGLVSKVIGPVFARRRTGLFPVGAKRSAGHAAFRWFLGQCIALALASIGPKLPAAEEVPPAAQAIRAEATRPNEGPEGWPLPLACHWNTGRHRNSAGWAPREQMRMIAEGHHILPFFAHPPTEGQLAGEKLEEFRAYYEEPLKQARAWGLPLSLKATQWESILSKPPFIDLPPEKNPNVLTAEGKILRKVSPFGPVGPWREAGRCWTDNAALRQLQEWYPDPPLVIFLSNNEHSKLRWHEAEQSQRYLALYGPGRDDDFKRRVTAEGWIERYRALQEGMREGLVARQWKAAARFVGYGAFGPPHFGRWGGWGAYSLHSQGRITPYPLMWDGGSPSYYTHDWDPSTDYTAWSPQIEFMNLVFVKREALRLNPAFWLEISVWDGDNRGEGNRLGVPELYRRLGQTYDPVRYQGFVQFGMWLMRPRAVREFRGWTWPSDEGMPYFMALVEAVDRVHTQPELRDFWRHGRLVPNPARQHLYQAAIPEEYKDEDRWFLLDADANPKLWPWDLNWSVSVFALALVQGDPPERRWLVYAHSPLQDRPEVKLAIPGFGPITVEVKRGGSFYLVDEKRGQCRLVGENR